MGIETLRLDHTRLAEQNGFTERYRQALRARPEETWTRLLYPSYDPDVRDDIIRTAGTPEWPFNFVLHAPAYTVPISTLVRVQSFDPSSGYARNGSECMVGQTGRLLTDRMPAAGFIIDDLEFAIHCLYEQYDADNSPADGRDAYLMRRIARPHTAEGVA